MITEGKSIFVLGGKGARAFVSALLLMLLAGMSGEAAAASVSSADASHGRSALRFAQQERWRQSDEHVRRIGSPALKKAMLWYKLKHPNSGGSFAQYKNFIEKNPHWPAQDLLMRQAEKSLQQQDAATRRAWFAKHPPQTALGRILDAELALEGIDWDGRAKNSEAARKAFSQIREAFRTGGLGREEQELIIKKYGGILTGDDYFQAAEALYNDERLRQADEMMGKLSLQQQHYFDARRKLIRLNGGAESALRRVPAEMQNIPGLLYDRLLWRHQRKLANGSVEILKKAPKNLPNPAAWWKIRKYYVWDAIEKGHYTKAYALLGNHGQKEGESFADAEWLAGWISYRYLKDYSKAYEHFYKLYHGVQYPISRSRGAYWAGMASLKHGEKEIGQKWLALAAMHPYTYYGQLAHEELAPGTPPKLPKPETISDSAFAAYQKKELPQAALALYQMDETALAMQLINHLVDTAANDAERTMAAMLGQRLKREDIVVKTSKQAMQQGTILPKVGYPVKNFAPRKTIEKELVMAITRQESQFKKDAKSPAGALGYMQVLPSTAKQVSKQLRLSYSLSKLTNDGEYNMQIGSAYLAGLINSYDGYYPLAIAAYNAGPGRVRQWMKEFGDPRDPKIDPVQWMERIPISETRNYVQRVLENLQMYRYKMGGYKAEKVRLKKDLYRKRG